VHTVATATTAFIASFSAETGASSTFCRVDFFFCSGLPPAAGFLPLIDGRSHSQGEFQMHNDEEEQGR
jgi:hypothetical protein